nr:HEPN domain-containing protein [Mycobacterium simiae]
MVLPTRISRATRPRHIDLAAEDGATLELIGGLSPGPEFQQTPTGGTYATELIGDVRPGTIYGESDSGQAVSIWDAQRGGYTAGLVGQLHEEFWHSSWICFGAHIPSSQEPVLTRATVIFDELYYLTDDQRLCPPQWATIKIEGVEDVENPGVRQADGTRLMPYIFPVIGGYRADYARGTTGDTHYSIDTTATHPWVSPATEAMPDLKLQLMTSNLRRGRVVTLRVGAHASIRLVDNASGSAADFVERIAALDDLVQLATFEDCGIEQITLEAGDDTDISLLMHVGKVARPDDVHKPASVVFTLADVPLEAYLNMRQRLTDGNQASYAWSVAVGLCGYSSRIVQEYVSQALAAAEGFHCWCLKGGDGVHLNTRLKALHDRLAPEVQDALGLDTEQWASWAVWARNHVAHGGTKSWRPLRDSLQLHIIAESVHLVICLAALQELGVPVAKVREALLNHPRLSAIADRSSQVNDLSGEPQV